MKSFCIAALAATATATTDSTFCDIINSALPDICKCVDTKTGLKVTCDQKLDYKVPPLGPTIIDTTVSFIYALSPCAKVASASLDVRSTDPKIDFPYTIKADKDQQIAVPDLAWSIPEVGKSKCRCHAAFHTAVTAIAAHHCAADRPAPRVLSCRSWHLRGRRHLWQRQRPGPEALDDGLLRHEVRRRYSCH